MYVCVCVCARARSVPSQSDSMAHAYHAHEAPACPFRSTGTHAWAAAVVRRESGHDGGSDAERRRPPVAPG